MDEDSLDLEQPKGRSVKQGRRARGKPTAESTLEADDTQEEQIPANSSHSNDTSGPPNRPAKAVSGWGEEAPRRPRNRQPGEGLEVYDDERLRPRTPDDDDDTDIPLIPELEEQQDEDMTSAVASAPNIAVNRVATFRELDDDLLRQAAFLTLDNEIDLKLLTKSLSPKEDLIEDDRQWDWDRLFTEVTSELITEWEKNEVAEVQEE